MSNRTQNEFARSIWTYLIVFLITLVILGTFLVGFVASIKDDALVDPDKIWVHQLFPANWVAAAVLGHQGNESYMNGGASAKTNIEFFLTYAVPNGEEMITPEVRIPKRRAGSGMAAIAYPYFAVDYIEVSAPILVSSKEQVNFIQKKGIKEVSHTGYSHTFKVTVLAKDIDDIPNIKNLPFESLAPRHQVLIDSSLPPSRTERRGRISAWNNISPGVIGYVFRSYQRVWNESIDLSNNESLMVSWIFNSFFIALLKMMLTVIIACLAGFALARYEFAGKSLVMGILFLSMTIPIQVSFISNYEIFNWLDLLNTPWAVIFLLVVSAQVLIMKQFFETFPKELEEAARVDGASALSTLIHVFVPIAKAPIASVAILSFQGAWNDFFWPLVVLTSPANSFTLPVGLFSLRNSYGGAGDWNLILAGAFISIVPIIVIFVFFQRYFVNNNLSSSVKG